jgi:signal transduction histidine kinase
VTSSKERRQKIESERAKRDRLAYVGTLAAGLVHEVRTPLNAIQLNAQLLQEDATKLPADVQDRFTRRMSRITTQIQDVVKTLDGFLAFARPPKMDSVPTDLNNFLRDLIEFTKPEFDNDNVKILYELAQDMYPVILDKGQFTHVMLNLFKNAREACGKNEEDPWVRVSTEEEKDFIIIDVDDNGTGILPEEEEKVFELFYSTKAKGTGLGLGIVRRIIEEHGGTIQAIDLPNAGARFRITLPRGRFLEFRKEE